MSKKKKDKHSKKNKKFITFDEVVTYDHLLACYNHCLKGKRNQPNVVNYEEKYQINLKHLLKRLKSGKYKIDHLYKFTIHEPKEREITANRFEDKIVQRLLCKYVLEPLIAPKLIFDNYASQPGKGTHKALERLEHHMASFAAENDYTDEGSVYSGDIHKYFYSINREFCFAMVDELPMDDKLKALIKLQIYATEEFDESTEGLCIGFQCSQWLAVYYLNGLDHFIKEELRIKHYGRYMDDFYIMHKDREYLEQCVKLIELYITKKLDLEMNPKSHIYSFSEGICFLGYHSTFNTRTHQIDISIRTKSINRMKKRVTRHKDLIAQDRITCDDARTSLESWNSYAKYGYSHKAKNAYLEARTSLTDYDFLLGKEREEMTLDNFDSEGFIKLKAKPDFSFRDKDGFIILRYKTTESETVTFIPEEDESKLPKDDKADKKFKKMINKMNFDLGIDSLF
jgi:hypothetical protein